MIHEKTLKKITTTTITMNIGLKRSAGCRVTKKNKRQRKMGYKTRSIYVSFTINTDSTHTHTHPKSGNRSQIYKCQPEPQPLVT